MIRKSYLTAGLLVAVFVAGAFWQWQAIAKEETGSGETVDEFLAHHWQDPLPPQGRPPAQFTALEASLDPRSCKQCHLSQWQDWQTSLHSHTMGAGIQWQLRGMTQEDANVCLRCHAPLAEQRTLIAGDRGWSGTRAAARPSYVPRGLGDEGLVCAACHVRGHERFGPPPRTAPRDLRAHGGFHANAAFEDSRFCAACHQFPQDGFRLAGKLPEDTLNQWRASRYAPDQSCQSCHMPDRRHLFRGIHDPEMVRKALDVNLEVVPDGDGMAAKVTVRNVGAGHHFPTYMVPKVELRLDLHGGGEVSRLDTHVLGWRADVGLTHEEFDTRIPAGAADTYSVRFTAPTQADWHVELGVHVAPREHYERMFQSKLARAGKFDPVTRTLLQQALREAAATHYEALRLRANKPER